MLGLSSNTVNEAAPGELRRYPLAVHYHLRCVKYWLKSLSMQSGRYPKACYAMLYNLDQHGKNKCTCGKVMLEQFGFRYVRAQQGVGDFDLFMEVYLKTGFHNFTRKSGMIPLEIPVN